MVGRHVEGLGRSPVPKIIRVGVYVFVFVACGGHGDTLSYMFVMSPKVWWSVMNGSKYSHKFGPKQSLGTKVGYSFGPCLQLDQASTSARALLDADVCRNVTRRCAS